MWRLPWESVSVWQPYLYTLAMPRMIKRRRGSEGHCQTPSPTCMISVICPRLFAHQMPQHPFTPSWHDSTTRSQAFSAPAASHGGAGAWWTSCQASRAVESHLCIAWLRNSCVEASQAVPGWKLVVSWLRHYCCAQATPDLLRGVWEDGEQSRCLTFRRPCIDQSQATRCPALSSPPQPPCCSAPAC